MMIHNDLQKKIGEWQVTFNVGKAWDCFDRYEVRFNVIKFLKEPKPGTFFEKEVFKGFMFVIRIDWKTYAFISLSINMRSRQRIIPLIPKVSFNLK